jgi:hypothetical protein
MLRRTALLTTSPMLMESAALASVRSRCEHVCVCVCGGGGVARVVRV